MRISEKVSEGHGGGGAGSREMMGVRGPGGPETVHSADTERTLYSVLSIGRPWEGFEEAI